MNLKTLSIDYHFLFLLQLVRPASQQLLRLYSFQFLKIVYNDRGIKLQSTIKTPPIKYEPLNSLIISIGQLGFILFTNMKTERREVNKLIRKTLLIYY